MRVTKTNLTCLLEAGLPSLQALVREKQARFFTKIQQRNGMLDDPLWYVLQLLKKENQVMYSHISEIMEKQDHIESDRRDTIHKLQSKEGTRYKTYCTKLSTQIYLFIHFIQVPAVHLTLRTI